MQITLDDLRQITQTINQLADRVQELESVEFPVISGGAVGAPDDASYVVINLTADLNEERNLSAGDGITLTDNGINSSVVLAVNVSNFAGLGLSEDGANNLDVNAGDGLQISGDDSGRKPCSIHLGQNG